MSKIIASTYEIKERIGSGGAGIVYLGRHLRLGIPVVLKADKRTLSTKQKTLRREVDALKNLNHTYIPQVYDFVVEDDTVYTVMAYIEGESLDKPLRRGESFQQAQVITWACQLLEALQYLHSQPPYGILHSDIKPANIMLTPQGDIRLIDYNIALALGEEGTVRVGYSRGYASPEHYGLDYSSHIVSASEAEATELLDKPAEYARVRRARQTSSTTSSGKRTVLLDVRSDIYGLGATLYHLLTGVRPSEDAKAVEPISSPSISPAVAAIIHKAMEPDPDQRYQSAQEMLYAFEHLHETDPRSVRHRKRAAVTAGLLAAVFLIGGLCTFTGLKQMERLQAIQAERERSARQALAAVTASEAAYQAGDIPQAIQLAKDALSEQTRYDAQAQKALTDALGIYDMFDGFRSHLRLELPGEPEKIVMSPEGTWTAVKAGDSLLVFDTASGTQLVKLAARKSVLAEMVFAGEDVIVYASEDALRAYDLTQGQELWSGKSATAIAISADRSTVAAVDRDAPYASVYNALSGDVLCTVDFDGKRQNTLDNDVYLDTTYNLLALNKDGSRLAVSFASDGASVYILQSGEEELSIFPDPAYTRFSGGFFGKYLAVSTWNEAEGETIFGVIDVEEMRQTGALRTSNDIYVQADESGIYVASGRLLVALEPETFDERELAYEDAYISGFQVFGGMSIIRTEDGRFSIYNDSKQRLGSWSPDSPANFICGGGEYAVEASVNAPEVRVLKLENNQSSHLMSYDKDCEHSEARLSADGQRVMLYRFDHFWVYDITGSLLADVDIPGDTDGRDPYDQQFRRDDTGSYLEVIYYSGMVRKYSAQDGSLLEESYGEAPDHSLYEEFLTDRYRITRELHGTPQVYDLESGELVQELQSTDKLIYVTQTGEYIIAEYWVTETKERYGLLLNDALEPLARLPHLCDISADGTLLFDNMAGNLRQSRIYSLEELLALSDNLG